MIEMGFEQSVDITGSLFDICMYCGCNSERGKMAIYRISSNKGLRVCSKKCAIDYINYRISSLKTEISELERMLRVLKYE